MYGNVKVILITIALIGFAMIGSVVVFPIVASQMDSQRTDAASESVSCTTSATGVCTITLAGAHAHYDTSGMTVTLGGSDKTSATTVDQANRQTLTVTGLTASTEYSGTVAYKAVDSALSDTQADFLRYAPLVALLAPMIMLGGLGIFVLHRLDVGPIVKGMVALGFVSISIYLLPTFYGWATRASGDSAVSGIGGFVGAIGILPIVVLLLIGIVVVGVIFGARRMFRTPA